MDINNNGISVIPFSSFLAGCLLHQKSISNSELCNISSEFALKYDVYFGNDDDDYAYEEIKWLFSEGSGFELLKDYDDVIKLDNGREIIVYEYLYKYTHVFVKAYFNLSNKEMPVTAKKKRS